MSAWIDVAAAAEFPPGAARIVCVDDVSVAVVNLDGDYHAVENACTHDGAVLLETEAAARDFIADGEVTCPRHGARFCIRTGAALSPPAYEPAATYPTRVADGMVQVGTERRD